MEKKVWIILLSLFLVEFLFSACGDDGQDSTYVGTWESVEHYLAGEREESLEGKTIIFNKDGTARTALGVVTYTAEEGRILFTKDGNNEPDVIYQIEDDTLVVDSAVVRIIYQKKE